jgi:hypothetical protein
MIDMTLSELLTGISDEQPQFVEIGVQANLVKNGEPLEDDHHFRLRVLEAVRTQDVHAASIASGHRLDAIGFRCGLIRNGLKADFDEVVTRPIGGEKPVE